MKMFTPEEVSAIVKRRLEKVRTIPYEQLRELLVAIADRLDDLDARVMGLESFNSDEQTLPK